ncbi:MAG: aminotransferase class I/II-fold pyridoxal phosphate-dependent enzyme [Leptolyngbyaceae cyanobacterium]
MPDLDETPLLTALAIAAARPQAAFYAPGHKGGRGAAPPLQALLGATALRADLPELPELDNLFAPSGPIQQAQELAAQTFGAETTHFLANGSTCGIEAAVLAVCSPGDKILVPRNAHQSVLAALVLSGAAPVYLTPQHDKHWDLAWGVTATQIEQALAVQPEIRAVIVVSPSYHGLCADIAAIAQRVHAHNAVLIVDEAHGPHLSFHPQLPTGAIAGGADIVIQSTHKVLGALTQASMLHVQGQRIDRDRLRQALQLTQSTSPNYWLLASLDAARYQMATQGEVLMTQTLALAHDVRSRLGDLAPLTVLTPEAVATQSAQFQLDLTRLVVDVSGLQLTGFTADEFLHDHGVTAELPTQRQLAFILSLGNTPADGDRLVAACIELIEQAPQLPHAPSEPLPPITDSIAAISQPPMTPRDAFFAPCQTVAIADAVGRIGVDTLCAYPPGIPLLLTGEQITAVAITQLQHIHRSGGVITGNPDAELKTLRVVSPV